MLGDEAPSASHASRCRYAEVLLALAEKVFFVFIQKNLAGWCINGPTPIEQTDRSPAVKFSQESRYLG